VASSLSAWPLAVKVTPRWLSVFLAALDGGAAVTHARFAGSSGQMVRCFRPTRRRARRALGEAMAAVAPPVCLFWDNSNIYIGAKRAASTREGVLATAPLRIHFDHLYKIATVGRKVARAYCVGSVPPELDAVWGRVKADTGVVPELYERGKDSGKEQGLDQCLQVWMLRALLDLQPPGVAVLLTGDGAGYDDGAGFHADLERMHKAGWGIEVVSWDGQCAKRLKTWAQDVGSYIKLEDHYEAVTFIEGGRRSKPPNLTRRPTAPPRK
jgi:hypothetical protein